MTSVAALSPCGNEHLRKLNKSILAHLTHIIQKEFLPKTKIR